ncbi:MAG: VCBS repeat-containing protein [Thermoanaerobaculia bacterium]|nr:VCBS repeat-containing protein [Thermoanaerobaculia bacterium]
MTIPTSPTAIVAQRGRRWPMLVCVLILGSVAGNTLAENQASQTNPPKSAPKAAPPTQAAPAPATEKPATEKTPTEKTEEEPTPFAIEPPEGVTWQTDEAGNEFFVTAMPKAGMSFIRVDDDTIRTRWGLPLELTGEDDENVYVKTFKVHSRPSFGPPPPTAEELAQAAETYEPKIPSADRLKLVAFDAGLPKQGALWRNGFDVADLNGDGQLDIVHGPPRKSFAGPFIFLGDGKGNWHEWEAADWPRIPWDYGDAVAADFNGDGKMDVAFGMHLKGVVATIGDGRGKFTLWSEGMGLELPGHKGDPAFSSREIDAADWNRDGRVDLVVYSEGPRGFQHVGLPNTSGKIVYVNQGDGTWSLIKKERPSPLYGDELVVADFNLDGRLDFVTSTNVRGQRKLLNFGTETGDWEPQTVEEIRPFAWVWTVGVGDFDADGRPDLAVAYHNREHGVRRAGVDVLLARADGKWSRKPIMVDTDRDLRDVHALATGDIDGDGAVDLVATTRFGEMFLYRGDGKGGFEREEEPAVEANLGDCRGYGLTLRDLDRDGRDEILATFASEDCPRAGWFDVWKTEPKRAD